MRTLSTAVRDMLRISYIWPDWNSHVRLGVFHTIFSTKRYISPPKFQLQIVNNQILNICRILWYYMRPIQISTPVTCIPLSSKAVMLLSDVDFVALNN